MRFRGRLAQPACSNDASLSQEMASLIWAFWLGEATARAATPPEPPRSVLLSTLHPISRTGYGGQAQLLVAELQRQSWHVQLLAWNLRHRGEPPAEDLETLLLRHKIGRSNALEQAGGDPRVLLSGVPLLTSRIAPPTGHETGEGWLESPPELWTCWRPQRKTAAQPALSGSQM